ncbi:MAG: hypothetical protein P0107_00870 [Nitrosomonas sp.]|nr:hypothetical protein [Nitrosomonas sp.]
MPSNVLLENVILSQPDLMGFQRYSHLLRITRRVEFSSEQMRFSRAGEIEIVCVMNHHDMCFIQLFILDCLVGDAVSQSLRPGAGHSAFTAEEAEYAGRLWQQTRQSGLSLGDRACLSLGHRLQAPVLTADQIWITLELSIKVHSLR